MAWQHQIQVVWVDGGEPGRCCRMDKAPILLDPASSDPSSGEHILGERCRYFFVSNVPSEPCALGSVLRSVVLCTTQPRLSFVSGQEPW